MTREVERKFLLGSLPSDIDATSKITYERYFLEVEPGREVRIQRKGDELYREVKTTNSELVSDKEAAPLTAKEFDELRQSAIGSIERDSYMITGVQNASVKIYHGRFEGLIRAEIEFPNTDAASHFSPPDWFGPEITESKLGRDSKLLKLSDAEFKSLLKGLA
jgi:adenylate cyclase